MGLLRQLCSVSPSINRGPPTCTESWGMTLFSIISTLHEGCYTAGQGVSSSVSDNRRVSLHRRPNSPPHSPVWGLQPSAAAVDSRRHSYSQLFGGMLNEVNCHDPWLVRGLSYQALPNCWLGMPGRYSWLFSFLCAFFPSTMMINSYNWSLPFYHSILS